MTNMTRDLKSGAWKGECLELAFCAIKEKKWDSPIASLELTTQIGQLLSIFCEDKEVEEPKRKFTNVSDELSDVLLSLLYIANEEKIDVENIDRYQDYTYTKINQLPVLVGQLTESLMEKYGYRFIKPREGFSTLEDFIEDRILRMIKILFNYAEEQGIDLVESFDSMCKEAIQFVMNKSQGHVVKEIPIVGVWEDLGNYGLAGCIR